MVFCRGETVFMADIIQFKKPRASDKARGKTLCKRGFHKWVLSKDRQFDTRQGRLVTVYRCSRCDATKTRAH
jgi:hypothetical protein